MRDRICHARVLCGHRSCKDPYFCALLSFAHLDSRTEFCLAAQGLRSPCVSFQPRVDPFRLESNGSPAADSCVMQLAPLARGVDGVATDAGVLGALAHGEPDLHTALRPGPRVADRENEL